MIENRLTFDELSCILRPFLRLDSLAVIQRALENTLRVTIASPKDAVCQNQLLITFRGYRVEIRGIQVFEGHGLSLHMEFKAPQKWWHELFGDQTREIINDLQRICQTEVDGLTFRCFKTLGRGILSFPALEGPLHLVFWHDSRALNREWKQGFDVSPLAIAPDNHDGKCFIDFWFNPLAYRRVGEKTQLRDDWMKYAFAISEGIGAEVGRVLGACGQDQGGEQQPQPTIDD